MKKKIIITLAVLVVAAGLIYGPSLLGGGDKASNASSSSGGRNRRSGNTVFSVRTVDAEIRNLQAYIEVNGNIVNQNQVNVVPENGGKLVSMRTALGSFVSRGELLAEIDPSRPGTEYSLNLVFAPVSGVVVSNPLSVGTTVSTTTSLLTIASGTSLEIEAQIPEREIGQLRSGLSAEIYLEAFPGEVFEARIVRLSPVVDPVSRTKNIVLNFIRRDTRINAGMFARIKLKTRNYENIITIPQEAIVESRGVQMVFVLLDEFEGETDLTDQAAEDSEISHVSMREIVLGVSVDGEAEIKSGVNAGEKVVIQGQQFLSDGAAVRVLESRL